MAKWFSLGLLGGLLLIAASFAETRPAPPVPPRPDVVAVDRVFDAEGLHVLVVYETEDVQHYKTGQMACLTAPAIRTWLQQAKADYRFFDDDVRLLGQEVRWQKGIEAAQAHAREFPWLIVQNGNRVWQGSLPASPDELKALLEKYR